MRKVININDYLNKKNTSNRKITKEDRMKSLERLLCDDDPYDYCNLNKEDIIEAEKDLLYDDEEWILSFMNDEE